MDYTKRVTKLNPSDIPMVETDFYAWLAAGNYQDNSVACKVAYLTSLGFIKGTDTIEIDTLRILGWISQHYFYHEVLPTIGLAGADK